MVNVAKEYAANEIPIRSLKSEFVIENIPSIKVISSFISGFRTGVFISYAN